MPIGYQQPRPDHANVLGEEAMTKTICITKDELYMAYDVQAPRVGYNPGRMVEVEEYAVKRWKRAMKAFEKAQKEMASTYWEKKR
jgi:hypothetical protein